MADWTVLKEKYRLITPAKLGVLSENGVQIVPDDDPKAFYVRVVTQNGLVAPFRATDSPEMPFENIPKIPDMPVIIGKVKVEADTQDFGFHIIALDDAASNFLPQGDFPVEINDPLFYKPTDEEKDAQAIARILADQGPIFIKIPMSSAFLVVSCMQMAVRVPAIDPTSKQMIEFTARQFQAVVAQAYPEAAEILEKGWKPEEDRSVSG